MRLAQLLRCERCDREWRHEPEGDTAMRCSHCGLMRGVDTAPMELTPIQIMRCYYFKHLVETRQLNEGVR